MFEIHPESYAKSAKDLDTSFMITGSSDSEEDVYTFTNKQDQIVTFVLTPEKQLDDFDMVLYNSSGRPIIESSIFNYIDSIQAQLPKGTYKIGVKLQ